MNNVIKYSDVYQKIVRKLNKGIELTQKEDRLHKQLCQWIAIDFLNETYTCNNELPN
jgi:hypothetical protein